MLGKTPLIAGVAVIACAALYWGTAVYAAGSLKAAFKAADTGYIADAINWDELLPPLSRDVVSAFDDPNAAVLGQMVGQTYSRQLEKQIRGGRSLEISSQGFSNLDEYTLVTRRGNRFVMRRHGLRWLVDRLGMTQYYARRLAIDALHEAHPDAAFSTYNKDIYFDSPILGCRLTDTKDVTEVTEGVSPTGLLAYVRHIGDVGHYDLPHTQIWVLDLDSLDTTLGLDGSQSEDPKKITDGQYNLHYSIDGRYLYFNVDAWATSSAIVEMDIQTKATRFISSGNGLEIVRDGRFAGDIVTSIHKYHPAGQGSYDWEYVIDRNGNELANSGRDLSDAEVKEFQRKIENMQ